VRAAVDAFPYATHFYMLSGDCMPIKSAEFAHAFLDREEIDYIESFDFFTSDWIKTGIKEERLIYRHWFNERTQKRLFYGSMQVQQKLGLARQVPADLQPQMRRNRNVVQDVLNPTGLLGMARFNHLHPPFDKPAVRRALLGAVAQSDFMAAVAGTDRSLWREGVGFFPPGTPMASDAGMEALTGPRDMDKVKRDLAAAGYNGEKVVLLGATDLPTLNGLGQVAHDMLRRAGMTVDYVATDWGTVVQRRTNREAPERGGWSMFCTFWAGLDMFNPGLHQSLRGHGGQAWFGWPTSPRIEALRHAWFDAPDLAVQQQLARQIQEVAFQDVPYLPLGQYFSATVYRRGLSGVLKGLPMFWNLQRIG
jgi:peptide/nickel transport system substrate-binding protein